MGKNQLLRKEKVSVFQTHGSCAPSLQDSFDTLSLELFQTHQDDQDAQYQAIQDNNPTITKRMHVEYDISKTETHIVEKKMKS